MNNLYIQGLNFYNSYMWVPIFGVVIFLIFSNKKFLSKIALTVGVTFFFTVLLPYSIKWVDTYNKEFKNDDLTEETIDSEFENKIKIFFYNDINRQSKGAISIDRFEIQNETSNKFGENEVKSIRGILVLKMNRDLYKRSMVSSGPFWEDYFCYSQEDNSPF